MAVQTRPYMSQVTRALQLGCIYVLRLAFHAIFMYPCARKFCQRSKQGGTDG